MLHRSYMQIKIKSSSFFLYCLIMRKNTAQNRFTFASGKKLKNVISSLKTKVSEFQKMLIRIYSTAFTASMKREIAIMAEADSALRSRKKLSMLIAERLPSKAKKGKERK